MSARVYFTQAGTFSPLRTRSVACVQTRGCGSDWEPGRVRGLWSITVVTPTASRWTRCSGRWRLLPDYASHRHLKVLLLTDVFPPSSGGSGWSTYYLGEALRERGHGVYVIRPRYGGGV